MRFTTIMAAGAVCLFSGSAFAEFERPVTPNIADVPPLPGFFWTAKARAFAGYNSNIQYSNDYLFPVTDPGGLVGGLTLDVFGEYGLTNGFSIGGALRTDLVGYTGGSNDDYDHYSLQPSIFVKHRHQMANGTDVTLQGTYSFRKTQARNWKGIDSTNHEFVGRAEFDVPGPWGFFLEGTIASSDYGVFAADPSSNRDGTFKEIIFGVTFVEPPPYPGDVTARFGLQSYDAAGVNWSYTGWLVGIENRFAISGPHFGKLAATFVSRDYVGDFTSLGYVTDGRKNQQVLTLEGKWMWALSQTHTFDIGLKHEIVWSNSKQFTGNQTALMGGLTVKLH